MGLFDWVRSSYPLGEDFSGQCQTKDMEKSLGGTMTQYWISPSGQLYKVDYSQTADFVELKEGDDGYDEDKKFFNFRWVPNGNHGKVECVNITDYVVIYPENWKGDYNHWPDCRIHFVNGKIQDYEILTKGDRK